MGPRAKCWQGHPLTEDNVYAYVSKREGRLIRQCRACHLRRAAEYYQRRGDAIRARARAYQRARRRAEESAATTPAGRSE